jgi:hypothetical protein
MVSNTPRMSADEWRKKNGLGPVQPAPNLIKAGAAVPEIETEAPLKRTKRNKHGNVFTEYESPLVGKRLYPSGLQARYAAKLDMLWKAGLIPWWLPEVSIPLGHDTAKSKRPQTMRIDFLVGQHDGPPLWQDTKGHVTPEWDIKRNLVEKRFGITIELIKKA